MRLTALTLVAVLLLPPAGFASATKQEPAATDEYPQLSADLDRVRQALGIPGMAAAVVQDHRLVWAQGFGFADLDNRVEADTHTPFGLASVTKPIAATLIMQLVEDGTVDLDRPVADYGVDVPRRSEVTVRHLLTHTSEGEIGSIHNYNGNRYGLLGGVIEGATGRTFASLLSERILVPLAMTDTALNPISSWGDTSLAGFEDLWRTLGWGELFEHYPDVYGRLAQPYQFGDDYATTAGMYHLTHNPAAGLNSSVVDLAKFDIALDTGRLLGESVQREMLSPAVSTAGSRNDLAYGLGWYVQDYDGIQLVWHAGRWPPSTSALYLKVPSRDLAFIVLANTDNLTVAYPDIGIGDVTHSTLALAFFHHFLFPLQHGHQAPNIDWTASERDLVAQLSAVDAGPALRFLERELWSYRQAYASSGQSGRAEVLLNVNKTVFPDSSLRRDRSYTWTAGKLPVVAPILSARTLMSISRVVVAWLIVVLLSLAWMVFLLLRERDTWLWQAPVWLVATCLVGPIAPLLYRRKRRRQSVPGGSADAACASLFCVAGYGLAWVVVVFVLLSLGDNPNPLAILGSALLIPLAIGLLFIRAPALMAAGVRPYRRAVRRGLFGELMRLSLAFAVFFPLTMYFDNQLLSTIPSPTSPYFGAMMSVLGLIGLAVLFPLETIMVRRGFGLPTVGSTGAVAEGQIGVATPTIRNSWWMLLGSVAVMVVSLGWAIASFG